MTRYPCRCRRCGARRTLAKHPDEYRREPKCACSGSYRVDWYRRSKEHKRAACYCSGYPWSIHNAGHQLNSPNCYNRVDVLCKDE